MSLPSAFYWLRAAFAKLRKKRGTSCRRVLHYMGEAEDSGFVEVFAQDLQADGQARLRLAAGDTDPRHADQIADYRIDVGQIHLQRIVSFFAQLKGWRGCGGSDNRVHLAEGLFKVASQQSADSLGFQVIGIVVAGAERISSEHDAALYLGAKTFITAPAIHLGKRFRMRRAVSVTDAVITSKIGRCLGSGNHII